MKRTKTIDKQKGAKKEGAGETDGKDKKQVGEGIIKSTFVEHFTYRKKTT